MKKSAQKLIDEITCHLDLDQQTKEDLRETMVFLRDKKNRSLAEIIKEAIVYYNIMHGLTEISEIKARYKSKLLSPKKQLTETKIIEIMNDTQTGE